MIAVVDGCNIGEVSFPPANLKVGHHVIVDRNVCHGAYNWRATAEVEEVTDKVVKLRLVTEWERT
jgi:hypothetical protein